MNSRSQMTNFMQMVWEVLDSAKDAGVEETMMHCRRLLRANRDGKLSSHEYADDKAHVRYVWDEVCNP